MKLSLQLIDFVAFMAVHEAREKIDEIEVEGKNQRGSRGLELRIKVTQHVKPNMNRVTSFDTWFVGNTRY